MSGPASRRGGSAVSRVQWSDRARRSSRSRQPIARASRTAAPLLAAPNVLRSPARVVGSAAATISSIRANVRVTAASGHAARKSISGQ